MLAWLGALHHVVVHFPVALVLAAGLAEYLALVRGERALRDAARYCITGGAFGALAALATGWTLALAMDAQGLHAELVDRHRWTGIGVGVAACAASVLVRAAERSDGALLQLCYRLCLWAAAVLAALAGWQGGGLAHGL